MLVVGLRGRSKEINGAGCTDTEYRTHFNLWCMLAAPLMIGCDVRNMDDVTCQILTNREVIAIDQDALSQQGYRASRNGMCEIWKKPLSDGHLGVGIFNRGDKTRAVPAHWSDLEISGKYQVRDLWAHTDIGVFDSAYSAEVEPHGSVLLRLTPAN
jgi:alpha-galactosidase